MTQLLQAIPVTPVPVVDWSHASRLLEQSIRAGNNDPQAQYLLALCYKRLGRLADAGHALSRIAEPDPNVLLQRGVLAFLERDFAKAAEHFEQARAKHPQSYAAAYNLMLTWLSQGKRQECVQIIPEMASIAPTDQERRFLELLRALLVLAPAKVTLPTDSAPVLAPIPDQEVLLHDLRPEEETRLVDLLGGLGQFDIAFPLLAHLLSVRPSSQIAFTAYFGAALFHGKQLMDKSHWEEAYSLLASLWRRQESSSLSMDKRIQLALSSMLGVCSILLQDYQRGAWYFRSARDAFTRLQEAATTQTLQQRLVSRKGVYQGAWVEQNLALAYEWQGKLDQAEPHWNRYFDYLEHYFSVSEPPEYLPRLAFEGLSRLADVYSKKEKWSTALGFLQRAARIRPSEGDVLERLFHLYTQLKRPEDARRTLRMLREVKPNDPQVDLFELEVREMRGLDDMEETLSQLRRLIQAHPGDMRVEERAAAVLNTVIPMLERQAEQGTSQVNRVVDQMRRLPNHQINWGVVREVMRDLEDRFIRIRRCAQRAAALVTQDEQRRLLTKLIHHCDRKMDQCHSLGE
ncbi:MAG: tetratricopeptide repeat protein [Gemmataceae bacterium]